MKKYIFAISFFWFIGLANASGLKYEAPASDGGGSGSSILPLSQNATNYDQFYDTGTSYAHANSSETIGQITIDQILNVAGGVPTAPSVRFDGESNTGLIGDGGTNPDAVGIVATGVLRYWQSASSSNFLTPVTVSTLTVTSSMTVTNSISVAGSGEPTLSGSTTLQLKTNGSSISLRMDEAYITGVSTWNFGACAVTLSSIAATPGGAAGAVVFYSSGAAGAAEAFVLDEAGNATQLSPHNSEGNWVFNSQNQRTGKSVYIDMEKFVRKMEELTGEQFIYDKKPD